MDEPTRRDIRQIEKKAFELLVNICDAWDIKDIPLVIRRIKLACKFFKETFQRRADYINSRKGVSVNAGRRKTQKPQG